MMCRLLGIGDGKSSRTSKGVHVLYCVERPIRGPDTLCSNAMPDDYERLVSASHTAELRTRPDMRLAADRVEWRPANSLCRRQQCRLVVRLHGQQAYTEPLGLEVRRSH